MCRIVAGSASVEKSFEAPSRELAPRRNRSIGPFPSSRYHSRLLAISDDCDAGRGTASEIAENKKLNGWRFFLKYFSIAVTAMAFGIKGAQCVRKPASSDSGSIWTLQEAAVAQAGDAGGARVDYGDDRVQRLCGCQTGCIEMAGWSLWTSCAYAAAANGGTGARMPGAPSRV